MSTKAKRKNKDSTTNLSPSSISKCNTIEESDIDVVVVPGGKVISGEIYEVLQVV